jgi:hypothetical protein
MSSSLGWRTWGREAKAELMVVVDGRRGRGEKEFKWRSAIMNDEEVLFLPLFTLLNQKTCEVER